MARPINIFWLLPLLLPGSLAAAPHVRGELIAEVVSAAPGDSFDVLFRQEIDPGWHTYWVNPGDSGAPPEITWRLPEGASASEFRWPYPERIPYGPLVNFGYEDQVLLLFTVTAPGNYPSDEMVISGSGSLLVCADICIPEKIELSLSLPLGERRENESARALFRLARSRLPAPLAVDSWFEFRDGMISLFVGLPVSPDNRIRQLTYFPLVSNLIDNTREPEIIFADGGLLLQLTPGFDFEPTEADLSGILVVDEEAGNEALVSSYAFTMQNPGERLPQEDMGLLAALLFAFLGGLILNLMPCVFPVLSIKILSLVESVHAEGGGIRLHGWTYAFGVILGFVIIALLLMALRFGGEVIGWGFQMQNPVVVGLLAYLFLLIGLNFLGVFEIGGRLMSLGGGMNSQGYGGSLATGLLATVVAAPCTAPFMGAAVGFALTQPSVLGIAVFASLGAGMATPYLLLCYFPGLLANLPGPGRWMLVLKQVLAFPMFASAIWLLWVLGIQTGVTGMMQVLGGGLLLTFAIWLVNQFAKESGGASVSRLVAVLLAVAAVYLVVMQESGSGQAEVGGSTGVATYSEEALELARRTGPVFVNFTAAWCITCKVNELNSLGRSSVKQAFKEKGVTYLKADWTNEDPDITRALQAYGRSGVPLYLLYGRGAQRAEVLPQILTESIMLDALESIADADPAHSF